jgi:hypothetical protein
LEFITVNVRWYDDVKQIALPGERNMKNGYLRYMYTVFTVKEQFHEIFDPPFFRLAIPLDPLIHELKPFQKWIQIQEYFLLQKIDSALSRNAWSWFLVTGNPYFFKLYFTDTMYSRGKLTYR